MCSFGHVAERVTGGKSVERCLFSRDNYWFRILPKIGLLVRRPPEIGWYCRERSDHKAVTLFLCFSAWRAW